MFSAMMARIKRAISSALGSLLGRVAIGFLFLMGAGFGLAALTLALIDQFGAQLAYWILAGGFLIIAGLATAILSAKEEDEAAQAAADDAQSSAVSQVANSVLGSTSSLTALTTLAPMLLSSSSFSSSLGLVRFLLRNLPLVVLGALVLVLSFPFDRMGAARATPPRPPPAPAE